MKIFAVFILLFFVTFCYTRSEVDDELAGIEFLPNFLPANITGRKYCPTEDIWRWKQSVRSNSFHFGEPLACSTQGTCDNPAVRNTWVGKSLTIRLYISVLCCSSTDCNGVTQQRVDDQVNTINSNYAGSGITFVAAQVNYNVDSSYCVIEAYSQSSTTWYTQLTNLKNKYAVSPTQYINVFVTGQKSGSQGTLLGIGTFPWDSVSDRATGGLWVNAAYFRNGDKTAAHELGHNLGLWHTFHGDSEVSCSSDCYETVHSDSSDTSASNNVGDFCADTPSQPMNYNCAYPTGTDCKGNRYTLYGNNPVLINNIMAYTPDSCMVGFTSQQVMRAHCWTCAMHKNYDSGKC